MERRHLVFAVFTAVLSFGCNQRRSAPTSPEGTGASPMSTSTEDSSTASDDESFAAEDEFGSEDEIDVPEDDLTGTTPDAAGSSDMFAMLLTSAGGLSGMTNIVRGLMAGGGADSLMPLVANLGGQLSDGAIAPQQIAGAMQQMQAGGGSLANLFQGGGLNGQSAIGGGGYGP